ncbi:MAG: TraR/DksA C4-type zinc finger protein [Pseudomonadota bacterium]|nr:TraR/DksA C4-type zinc finger protein [Pseudomonadota bacterium]
MRVSQVKTLQRLLLGQKESLLNKTERFRLENRQGFQAVGDEADQASSELARSLNIRLIERERVLVQKIDRALEKITQGRYGYCDECATPLDFSRLKARPVASMCIDCKLAQEQEEQLYA